MNAPLRGLWSQKESLHSLFSFAFHFLTQSLHNFFWNLVENFKQKFMKNFIWISI